MNVSKTKHMAVSPTLKDNVAVANNLQYNKKKIEIVSEYTYLSIELDNKLTMENHINKSVNKAN